MKTYNYIVAGFSFAVQLPEPCEVKHLLPSFLPFQNTGNREGEQLFSLTVVSAASNDQPGDLLEETDNDMGHLRLFKIAEGYRVEITNKGYIHRMWSDRRFTAAKACLDWNDRQVGNALSSLLRIQFAQAVIYRNAVSIHAAAVSCKGLAYLFMGKSGTGKSTHAALWVEHIPGTELLNDDNPTVRLIGDKAYAYGTPWSGKTPCYKQLGFPIGGMVRLQQASVNRFTPQEGTNAFVALYPGCSVIAQDTELRHRLYDTLARLAESAPVGLLDCRPDKEAAIVCHQALAGS